MALVDLIDLSSQFAIPLWALVIIVAWTLVWKGFALWKSARLTHKTWFILILILNTFGILEILYLFIFSRMKFDNLQSKQVKRKKR